MSGELSTHFKPKTSHLRYKSSDTHIVSVVEMAIIGGVVLGGNKSMALLVDMNCLPDWFVSKKTRTAYMGCEKMYSKGQAIDPITLTDEISGTNGSPMEKTERSNRILDFITECIDCCSSATMIGSYATQVESVYKRGYVLQALECAAEDVRNAPDEMLDEIVGTTQDKMIQLITKSEEEEHFDDVADDCIDNWENISKDGEKKGTGVKWPVASLDTVIGPLKDELVWLVAAASVGKTAFVLQLMVNSAKVGVKTSLASLESKKARLFPRLVSQVAEINTLRMDKGRGHIHDLKHCKNAREEIKDMHLSISDCSASLEQLRAWGKAEKAKGSKLLIIDNTRHIRMKHSSSSPVEATRELSIKLKWMRDDLDIPIMVLHHASAEGKAAWSGDIRNDADIMIFIRVNEDKCVPASEENGFIGENHVLFDIDKNRDGLTPTIEAEFLKQFQKFK